MSKRPTLDSLSSRFARKDAPAEPAAAVPAPEPAAAEPEPAPVARAPKREQRVQILTRIDAPTRKRLKLIAVEQDRTIQEICEEAIRDFVTRHSR
ncbi:hypothetical protein [Methylobacterium platani]|uniref:Ribbon-helix-helix protein CopG domain-containing protein n=2 Tax=Methylobacterium platani TaxID=427683 RepID=A0A179SGC3_9HYPH|nr:hypothetical protein [Methylobacterium platani]KMO13383.1 hypothetical protein SQ03_22005 [Methylobacterium platani JCM 14648]OAS26005.1 hypothetical protein A5481_07550 [Methylobacterium platani]